MTLLTEIINSYVQCEIVNLAPSDKSKGPWGHITHPTIFLVHVPFHFEILEIEHLSKYCMRRPLERLLRHIFAPIFNHRLFHTCINFLDQVLQLLVLYSQL